MQSACRWRAWILQSFRATWCPAMASKGRFLSAAMALRHAHRGHHGRNPFTSPMFTKQSSNPPCQWPGGGQFLITIGTNPYQNTYFIFFFTVFSYVFSLFSPVFQDLQNTPTEYNRIHCILNNTREYTQNTHRIHNVQKRRKVLFAQYTC